MRRNWRESGQSRATGFLEEICRCADVGKLQTACSFLKTRAGTSSVVENICSTQDRPSLPSPPLNKVSEDPKGTHKCVLSNSEEEGDKITSRLLKK